LQRFFCAALISAVAPLGGCDMLHHPRATDSAERICIDQSAVRIPDDECGQQPVLRGAGHWLYLSSKDVSAMGVPAVGEKANGGSPVPGVAIDYRSAPSGGTPAGG
jgi:hypothetical protein